MRLSVKEMTSPCFAILGLIGFLLFIGSGKSASGAEPAVQQDFKPISHFDKLVLHRSACYGNCPVYKVTILGNGHIDYFGEGNVATLGPATGTLSPKQLSEVVAAINDADYLALSKQNLSSECRTDSSSATTSLCINHTLYKISHYHGTCAEGSKIATALENTIDKIVKVETWIGTEAQRVALRGHTDEFQDELKRDLSLAENGDYLAQRKLGLLFYNTEYKKEDHAFRPFDPPAPIDYEALVKNKNYQEAVKWLTKAADQGDPESQLRLGVAYHEGRGVKKDDDATRELWEVAAATGHIEALISLTNFYRNEGPSQDLYKAYYWCNVAAKVIRDTHHYVTYENFTLNSRPELEKKLTPEQISDVKKRVEEWKPAPVPVLTPKSECE